MISYFISVAHASIIPLQMIFFFSTVCESLQLSMCHLINPFDMFHAGPTWCESLSMYNCCQSDMVYPRCHVCSLHCSESLIEVKYWGKGAARPGEEVIFHLSFLQVMAKFV